MTGLRTAFFRRPAFLVLLMSILYGLAVVLFYKDPLALVTVGSQFAPQELLSRAYSEEGYDGQFVYYLARYGTQAEPYIDMPAYRAQRILLSAAGFILSFGQPDLLPWAIWIVNLAALTAGTWLLEELLSIHRVSRWFALGYALSLGVFGAVRLNTTEPLAYALVLAGIFTMQHNRWKTAAVCFGLAAISRETTLFFPAAYVLYQFYRQQWKQAFIFGAISVIPFLIWQGFLITFFGTSGIGSGGAGTTGFALIPFSGFIETITIPLRQGSAGIGIALALQAMLLFVSIPTFWAIWQIIADTRYSLAVHNNRQPASALRGWTLTSLLLAANVLIMPFVPFSTYREPLGILRFIVGLQIALILYAAERKKKRALLYSTLWFITSFLVIASDFSR